MVSVVLPLVGNPPQIRSIHRELVESCRACRLPKIIHSRVDRCVRYQKTQKSTVDHLAAMEFACKSQKRDNYSRAQQEQCNIHKCNWLQQSPVTPVSPAWIAIWAILAVNHGPPVLTLKWLPAYFGGLDPRCFLINPSSDWFAFRASRPAVRFL